MLPLFLAAWLGAVVAAEVPVADFARHEKFRDAKISPDGKYLAVTGIVDDRTVLGLIRLADMKAVDIRPRNREDIAEFWWVAPDKVMYTVAVHFGSFVNPRGTGELFTVNADGSDSNIIFGLRATNLGGGDATVVGERAAGVLIAPLRDDPRHALIASYPLLPNTLLSDVVPSAYRIDLADGRKEQLNSAGLRGAVYVADQHGVLRFAYGSPGSAGNTATLFYRKDADSAWEPIESDDPGFVPLRFDRAGAQVYARCSGAGKLGGICRWDTATRHLETLWSATESSDAQLVETFDGRDVFAIRTQAGGRPATVLLDKSAPEAAVLVSLMRRFTGVDVEITSAATDGSKVVFLAHGDDDPGVYYLHDVAANKTVKLLERRPWLKPQQMAQMEPIAVKARDGLQLHGYLTRPVGQEHASGLPLVVLVHGGPYGMHDQWDFDPVVQLLASRGFAVLQVNFRGSGGYGVEFMRAGYRDWGGKMQDDVTDATRWAVAQGIADPARICIFGSSYGGYAALEGAAREPDLYRCAIGYAGVYDLPAWIGGNDLAKSSSGAGFLEEHVGSDESQLRERSPLTQAARIKARVMLIAGGADPRVPAAQADAMRAALAKNHNEPEWVYERTEGHGFYDEDHVTRMYERLLDFLDRQIGARRAPATAVSQAH
jgi:dipeptidyl aminopeptidase/acylaminoacyl peptidase